MASLALPPGDDSLVTLCGALLPSDFHPDVHFRPSQVLGQGGMAVAFLAERVASSGRAPVVIKVMRPSLVLDAPQAVELLVRKESVALGRLNERVPPTPFVVRLLETGVFHVRQNGVDLTLPWIAVEYVHGGAEGTTLAQRIEHSTQHSGYSFDPVRAAHAVRCLTRGLEAIHEVGVTHRDLTPANVLCCGFGADEIFKIADFGLARPAGMSGTFALPVGTPGYAAPEQITSFDKVGPATDVFAMSAVIYNLITAEPYFVVSTPAEGIAASHRPERRSILEAPALSPEIRERPAACAAIDSALARATSHRPEARPRAAELGWMVMQALCPDTLSPRPSSRRLRTVLDVTAPTLPSGWTWTIRNRPGSDDRVVRAVAWDGDGTCLAATTNGLEFWNGTGWDRAQSEGLSPGLRFIRRAGPGAWIVGGDAATFAYYSREGVSRAVHGPDPSVTFTHASGDLDDLLVVVSEQPGQPPAVSTLVAGRRWLPPDSLPKVATISSVARLMDERWLLVGRTVSGEGFAAMYEPLARNVKRLPTPSVRAYIACASQPDQALGLVVGVGGRTLRVTGDETYVSIVDGEPDLSACAISVLGEGWTSSAGKIWFQQPFALAVWRCVFSDATWSAPFVSMHASVGLIVAVGADGAVLEGRMPPG